MSSANKQVWGGIFCIIPFLYFYDEQLLGRIRKNLRKYFGLNSQQMREFSAKQINERIELVLMATIDRELNKHKGSWTAVGEDDLIGQSFGFAIFKDGKILPMSVQGAFGEGDWGANKFINANLLGGALSPYKTFLKGWNVVIFNYAIAAARIEAEGQYPTAPFYTGFNKGVMIQMISSVVSGISSSVGRKGNKVYYGYILNAIQHPEYRGKAILRSVS